MQDDKFDKEIDHEPEATKSAPATGRKWSRAWIVGALALAGVGGLGVAGAMSNDFGPARMMHAAGWGPHGGHGPQGGPRMMGRVLDELDASDAQRDQLRDLMRSTRNELEPLMDQVRDTRGELAALLAAPTIDRAAVEKLRTDRLADIDQASQKVTNALIQAAEVLTPEQRKALGEHFQERRGWGRW